MREIRKEVPLVWSQWLDKLTAAQPEDRPSDASAALACMPSPVTTLKKNTAVPNSKLIQPTTASPAGVAQLSVANTGSTRTGTSFGSFTPATPVVLKKSSNSKLLVFSISALVVTAAALGVMFTSNKPEETLSLVAKPAVSTAEKKAPAIVPKEPSTEESQNVASIIRATPVPGIPAQYPPSNKVSHTAPDVKFIPSNKIAHVYKNRLSIPDYGDTLGESIIYPHETKAGAHILGVTKIGQFKEKELRYAFFYKEKLRTRTCTIEGSGFSEDDGWKIDLTNPSKTSKNYDAELYFIQGDANANVVVKIGSESFRYLQLAAHSKPTGRQIKLQLSGIPANAKFSIELTYSDLRARAVGGFSGLAIKPYSAAE